MAPNNRKTGLSVAPPPRRPSEPVETPPPSPSGEGRGAATKTPGPVTPTRHETSPLDQTRATTTVQLNIKVDAQTKRALRLLGVTLDRTGGSLVTEAVAMLQDKYGKV